MNKLGSRRVLKAQTLLASYFLAESKVLGEGKNGQKKIVRSCRTWKGGT